MMTWTIRIMLLGLMAVAGQAGCRYEYREIKKPFPTLRDVLKDWEEKPAKSGANLMARQDEGWAILLESFEGNHREIRARRLARRLEKEAGLPDIWTRELGANVAVYRGHYPDPNVNTAQNDLRQTRMVQLDGIRPYETVTLVPLTSVNLSPQSSPTDLRLYQGRGLYTLQIGSYDSEFGPHYAKAAEKAAEALRAEGEEAFYHHGRDISVVTAGLFTYDETFEGDHYSEKVEALRKKYRYNLVNGRTYIVHLRAGDKGVEQETQVFSID